MLALAVFIRGYNEGAFMAFCHGEYPVESVGHIKEASKIIQSAKTNKMAEEDDEQEISLSSALETELNDEKD